MDAIRYVQRRGVGMHVDAEGRLRAYPAHRVDVSLNTFIRDHRDQIIAALVTPDIDTTIGNFLALSPEEREQYRQELAAASDDRPYIEHDREAYRRAVTIIRQRLKGVA